MKQVIEDYNNGWCSATDLVDSYIKRAEELHLGHSLRPTLNAALEPLANFICYVYSEENTSGHSVTDYAHDETVRNTFTGKDELLQEKTLLELAVKQSDIEKAELIKAYNEQIDELKRTINALRDELGLLKNK